MVGYHMTSENIGSDTYDHYCIIIEHAACELVTVYGYSIFTTTVA